MSFDFSDLVIPDDGNENDFNYDFSQFLADPIYDWLNSPEEILQVCDTIEDEKRKKEKLQLFNNHSLNTHYVKNHHIAEVHTAKKRSK